MKKRKVEYGVRGYSSQLRKWFKLGGTFRNREEAKKYVLRTHRVWKTCTIRRYNVVRTETITDVVDTIVMKRDGEGGNLGR